MSTLTVSPETTLIDDDQVLQRFRTAVRDLYGDRLERVFFYMHELRREGREI